MESGRREIQVRIKEDSGASSRHKVVQREAPSQAPHPANDVLAMPSHLSTAHHPPVARAGVAVNCSQSTPGVWDSSTQGRRLRATQSFTMGPPGGQGWAAKQECNKQGFLPRTEDSLLGSELGVGRASAKDPDRVWNLCNSQWEALTGGGVFVCVFACVFMYVSEAMCVCMKGVCTEPYGDVHAEASNQP